MDIKKTRRAVSVLIVCGLSFQLLSAPASAEQIAPRDPVVVGTIEVAESDAPAETALSAGLRQLVEFPVKSAASLRSSAMEALRLIDTEQAVADRSPAEASLTLRGSQPMVHDQRRPLDYSAELISSTQSTAPLGPVIFAGSGQRSRERIDVLGQR